MIQSEDTHFLPRFNRRCRPGLRCAKWVSPRRTWWLFGGTWRWPTWRGPGPPRHFPSTSPGTSAHLSSKKSFESTKVTSRKYTSCQFRFFQAVVLRSWHYFVQALRTWSDLFQSLLSTSTTSKVMMLRAFRENPSVETITFAFCHHLISPQGICISYTRISEFHFHDNLILLGLIF